MSESRSTGRKAAWLFHMLREPALPSDDELLAAVLAFQDAQVRVVPIARGEVAISATFSDDDGSASFMTTLRLVLGARPIQCSEATLRVKWNGRPNGVDRELDAGRSGAIARRLCRHELARAGRSIPRSIEQVLTTSVACVVLRDWALEEVAGHGPFVYVGGKDRDWARLVSARGVAVRSIQAVDLVGSVVGSVEPLTARLAADIVLQAPDRSLLLAPAAADDGVLAARTLCAYPGQRVVYVKQPGAADVEFQVVLDSLLHDHWEEVQRFELPDPREDTGYVSILRRRQIRPADAEQHDRELIAQVERIKRIGASPREVKACLMALHEKVDRLRTALVERLERRGYEPGLFVRQDPPDSDDEVRTLLWSVVYPSDAVELAAAVCTGAIAWSHPVLQDLRCDPNAKVLADASADVRALLLRTWL